MNKRFCTGLHEEKSSKVNLVVVLLDFWMASVFFEPISVLVAIGIPVTPLSLLSLLTDEFVQVSEGCDLCRNFQRIECF